MSMKLGDLKNSRFLTKEDTGDGIVVTFGDFRKDNVAPPDQPAEMKWIAEFEEDPDFDEAIYNLALTYEHLGNIEKSIDLWQMYQEKIGSKHDDYPSVRSHIRTLKKKVD